MHHPDPDEYQFQRSYFNGLKQAALPLQRRRGLHPMDPEALDEEELETLERLEEEMNDL